MEGKLSYASSFGFDMPFGLPFDKLKTSLNLLKLRVVR